MDEANHIETREPSISPDIEIQFAQSETTVAPTRPHYGRRAGVPNRSTVMVREAIALFAEQGAGRLWKWLEEVDDPAKRVQLYLQAIEYHIPKLARTEVTGADGGPQQHTYRWLDDRDPIDGVVLVQTDSEQGN